MTNAPATTTADARLAAPPRAEPSKLSLFLDLDGALARIEPTPGEVGPDPARREILGDLMIAAGGRVAVVSGRALADLDRILEGAVTAVGAVHGLVRRRADGSVVSAGATPRVAQAAEAFSAFAKADPGLLVEAKGASVALHYRRSPGAAEACRDLARREGQILGLVVQEGDQVVELRSPGPDKGAVVRAFMREPPFAGHTPVFMGDDLTDEAGFRAAQDLGGYGIVVGGRRPTAADYALRDVPAALAWLRGASEARP
jgi:trehalose 6-phosphate phosphatase